MAVSISFNGVVFSIPETGDESWGENLTSYFVAIPQGALQKTGGVFTLTGEVNFGPTYGLASAYYKTRATNPSNVGLLRLAVGDSIGWRNNADSANLLLAINASDQLTFGGSRVYIDGITALTGDVTATGPGSAVATVAFVGAVTAANVAAGATLANAATAVDTASAIVRRDASGNFAANNVAETYATTVTAAGTTTLTVASAKSQFFTGSTTQSVVLPNATTLSQTGFQYYFVNLSSGAVTIKDAGSNTIQVQPAASWAIITATNIGSANGSWNVQYGSNNAGGGTVTSVTFTGDGTVLSATPSSAVTTSGTLTAALATQSANVVLAGRATAGSAVAPTFRALVLLDMPQQDSIRYQNTAGTSITNTFTTIPFATQIFDTNSTFVGATGIFTCKVAGKYAVTCALLLNATIATSNGMGLIAYKNSSTVVAQCSQNGNGGTNETYTPSVSTIVDLAVSDTINVQARVSPTTSLDTTVGVNFISIIRISS